MDVWLRQCVCVWGLERCCDLVALLLLQTKASRSPTEQHMTDRLRSRFTALMFLPQNRSCNIVFSSQSYSHPVLPGFGSQLFFLFFFLFLTLLHLSLQVSVTLCLSLTSDICFDLVKSSRLRALWGSFRGCEAQLLTWGFSAFSSIDIFSSNHSVLITIMLYGLSVLSVFFCLSPVLFCFFPPASVTLIHLSLMMLHFSTSRFALYFGLFLH